MGIWAILTVIGGILAALFIFFALRQGEKVKPDGSNDHHSGSSWGAG